MYSRSTFSCRGCGDISFISCHPKLSGFKWVFCAWYTTHTPSITRIILVFGSTGQLAVHRPPAFEFWISSGPAPIQQFELEYTLSQAEVLPSFCGAECSSLQHVLSVLTTHASPIWFPKVSISMRMLLSPLTIPLLSKLPTPSYYRHLYADFSTRARLMANNDKATLHVRRMIQNSILPARFTFSLQK